jgi:hypothetical protein
MCNDPGTPAAFQEGGEVFGTVAGTPVSIGTPGQYQPGITDLAYGLMQEKFGLPEQEVAGLTPDQLRAFELANAGIGSYQPFLEQAESLTGEGLEALRASLAGLAPGAAKEYMNPFEEAVIQQTMSDIGRQGRIAQQGLASQTVAAGAFGGSRGQLAQSELQRNVLDQQARTAAQLRASGFESAANRAMQGAQLTGQLGQGIAGLGQQFVGLGQVGQQLGLQDINTMLTVGQQQQRQEQARLDALRANQMQTAMQPFQQLAFASDIITGAPSGQTATLMQPGPSIGSQLVGLGTAAYGLSRGFGT